MTAILFDYGATLDTFGQHWGMVIWHGYEHLGIPVTEAQYRDAYVYGERTLGSKDIIQPTDTFLTTLDVKIDLQFDFLRDSGAWLPESGERTARHDALVEYLYSGLQRNMSHTRQILVQLRDRGIPMALVSNFYGNVETVLEEMQIRDFFCDVIESAQVGIRKPDPRLYALGVEALRKNVMPRQMQESDVLVVGDSISKDILPAKSLGCKTAWFKGEGWKKEPVDETIPDFVIKDLQDVIQLTIKK
jgi:putative hydrolase of the HAD superfamily